MKILASIVAAVVVLGCNSHRDVLSAEVDGSRVDCVLVGTRMTPASIKLGIGDTARFSVEGVGSPRCQDAQANNLASSVWSSSDTLVARVDSVSGLARAIATGLVTITASARTDRSIKSAGFVQVVP